MFKCHLLKSKRPIKSSRVPLVYFSVSLHCEIRGFRIGDENYVSNFWLTVPYSLMRGYGLVGRPCCIHAEGANCFCPVDA
jgi:hypothetical protein